MTRAFLGISFVFVVAFTSACGTRLVVGDQGDDPGARAGGNANGSGGAGGADGGAFPGEGGTPAPGWQWLSPSPAGNNLRGVWATSANDVWLVGEKGTILHWDGAIASSPYAGAPDSTFYAVWASGPSDVWIAGDGGTPSTVLHFDGSSWSSEYSLASHRIHALWGSAANDVWAAVDDGATPGLQHWDGARWSAAGSYDGGSPLGAPNFLRDVWGASANDAWAVGDHGVILHYTGPQSGVNPGWPQAMPWTRTKAAAPDSISDPFSADKSYLGVWGSAANDVWAMFVSAGCVGSSMWGFSHYDGTAWSVVPVQAQQCLNFNTFYELPGGPIRQGHLLWGSGASAALATQFVGAPDSAPYDRMLWNGTTWSAEERGYVTDDGDMGTRAFASDRAGNLYAVKDYGVAARAPSWSGAWTSLLDAAPRYYFSVVAATSMNEAWAAETLWTGIDNGLRVDHWDGTKWSRVSLGNELSAYDGIRDVGASAPDDVWAVGSAVSHWDGSAWSTPLQLPASLDHVLVQDRTHAWATGQDPKDRSLVIFRWDGVAWSKVPVPASVNDGDLTRGREGIPFALPNGDLLVLATAAKTDDANQVSGTRFLFKWTGNAFVDAAPAQAFDGGGSMGMCGPPRIFAASATDVWLPGGLGPTLHYDGTAWHTVNLGTDFATCAVVGLAPDDVWIAGQGVRGGAIRHWDGAKITTALDVSPLLTSLSLAPGRDALWAVGEGGTSLRLALPRPAR